MPHNETDVIEAIIAEIISKVRKPKPAKNAYTPLLIEAKLLKKRVIAHLLTLQDPAGSDKYLSLLLTRLIEACDQLFLMYNEVSPDTQVLLNLIGFIRSVSNKKIDRGTELPLAFIYQQNPILTVRWEKLEAVLQSHQMPGTLIDITGLPVEQFNNKVKKLTWGDYTWVKRYFSLLLPITAHGFQSPALF